MSVLDATAGEWTIPAIHEQTLAIRLDAAGREAVPHTPVSLCTRGERRVFELPVPMRFAGFLLPDPLLARAAEETIGGRIADLEPGDQVQDTRLHALLGSLWHERQNGFPSGALFLDSMGTALAAYLMRHYSNATFHSQQHRGGLGRAALRRCLELIEAHLDRPLQLHELARETGSSVSHFARAFRESVGTSPHQFLVRRRVERAKELLRDRRVSLTGVAMASGFADQHHLARVFHRIAGMPPSAYRRSLS